MPLVMPPRSDNSTVVAIRDPLLRGVDYRDSCSSPMELTRHTSCKNNHKGQSWLNERHPVRALKHGDTVYGLADRSLGPNNVGRRRCSDRMLSTSQKASRLGERASHTVG